MPQQAVICRSVLESAGKLTPPKSLANFKLTDFFGSEAIPTSERLSGLIADIDKPNMNDENRVFELEVDQNGEFLGLLHDRLQRNESEVIRMVNYRHLTVGLGMPFWPLAHLVKVACGIPCDVKDRAFLEGWAALGTMVVGLAFVATQNPILNADRYVRLALQNDQKFPADLDSLYAAIQSNQNSPSHIFRDHVFEKGFLQIRSAWNSAPERIELNAEGQVEQDTQPFFQRVLYSIFSRILRERKAQEVRVKVDLLANPASKKMAIVFRSSELW